MVIELLGVDLGAYVNAALKYHDEIIQRSRAPDGAQHANCKDNC